MPKTKDNIKEIKVEDVKGDNPDNDTNLDFKPEEVQVEINTLSQEISSLVSSEDEKDIEKVLELKAKRRELILKMQGIATE